MAVNIYEKIVYQINNLIKQEDIYPKYMECIVGGKNDYKISQVYTKRNYSNDWIETIEECIVSLDNIVRNPRKFIVIEEDIVDISLARSISVESVKHLSQHTNLISSVTKDGMVIPSKILNTSKEESFDIYENRFIYTLLLKLRDFIDRRFTVMQNAAMQSGELGIYLESEFTLENKGKVKYKLDTDAKFPYDAVVKRKSSSQMTDMERVSYIKGIISDFLASPFAKEMRSCALVRPPIQRTNVILKNPDFKKALVLWQFVETSENMDFSIESVTETNELPDNLSDKYRGLIFLNTVLLQSIANSRNEGDMGSGEEQKEKTEADEYSTKNIDDFVPDDFPLLKMELSEIRRIYRKLGAGENTLSSSEISKLNGALDRVIRQQKINQAKEDSIRQQKLIEAQLAEEKIAKRLALREQKDLERKARQAEARRRLQLKKDEQEHQEKLRLLKQAAKEEAERKEIEARAEAERQAEIRKAEIARMEQERLRLEEDKAIEQRRVAELREIQDFRQAEELRIINDINASLSEENTLLKQQETETKAKLAETQLDYDESIAKFKEEEASLEKERREHIERIAKLESEKIAHEEESKVFKRLIAEETRTTKEIEANKINVLKQMKQDSDDYWREQQEIANKMGINLKLDALRRYEDKQKTQINERYNTSRNSIEMVRDAFVRRLTLEDLQTMEDLIEIASKHMTEKEILDIVHEYDKKRRKRNKKWFLNRFNNLIQRKTTRYDND